jgi:hypothetical protein
MGITDVPARPTRALVALVAGAAMLAASVAGGSQDPLAQIIARNTQARGGAAAIERAKAVQMRIRIVEPKYTMDAVYRATRGGQMRIDVYMGGTRVYSEGCDARRAWDLPADASHAEDSSAAGAAALRHGLEYPTNLLGLHEVTSRGHHLSYAGREEIDDVNYHVLRLTLADGFTTYFYVNPRTWLIERQRDERALHPDADPAKKWIEQRFGDYRTVEGRKVAFKGQQYDLRNGTLLQSSSVTQIETNPVLKADEFAAP